MGVRATTLAVRSPVKRSAISPNVSPGPRVWGVWPPSGRTSAWPRSMK